MVDNVSSGVRGANNGRLRPRSSYLQLVIVRSPRGKWRRSRSMDSKRRRPRAGRRQGSPPRHSRKSFTSGDRTARDTRGRRAQPHGCGKQSASYTLRMTNLLRKHWNGAPTRRRGARRRRAPRRRRRRVSIC